MKYRLLPTMTRLCCLFLVLSGAAAASEIYHWVDENGVHHYSDDAPAESTDVQTLEVDGTQPADYDPNEDRYNIAAQAEATQEVWDRLEESRKEKQEQRQRDLERQASTQVIYYPEPDYGYGSNIYYPPFHPRPPFRPPLKPVHPIEPPVVQPPYSAPFRPPGR